jgi:hypothetical protein
MNTIAFIRSSLENSKGFMMGFFEDLKDEPFAQPTAKGGNHALWILGHLAYSESSMVHSMVLGKESCPLQEWKDLFGFGSEPQCDASVYPSYEELLVRWEEARAFSLATLDSMSDADLDKPALGCPDEWKAYFGTIGLCYSMLIMHPTMHYGQLSDIRRTLGRPIMMA